MISRVCGKIRFFKDISVLIETHGIWYEILVPKAILKVVRQQNKQDDDISLITYHYYQTDPSRSIPILIGFMNEVEREFFEKFISVSGIGPRAAVKALSLPFSTIAQAIHAADIKVLKSLPGIGQQRAREIIAKLQGKMGKYGLLQDSNADPGDEFFIPAVQQGVKEEALAVLLQLQYTKPEAMRMIDGALSRNPDIKTCEDLLNEVYRQKQQTGANAPV